MIAQLVLRATLLLVLALIVSIALRRAAAELRRRLWAGTLLGLLLLPILTVAAPPLGVPVLARPAQRPFWPPMGARGISLPLPTPLPAAAPIPRSARWTLSQILAALYGLGATVSLIGLVRARRQARRPLATAHSAGAPWEIPAGIEARETDAVALPSTIGALRPIIVLPLGGRAWPAEARRAVLAHEVAHVRRHDPLWQLVAELARALYWWHPLVHLAARQLRVERELAADDHALIDTGIAPNIYAELLFDLACLPAAQVHAGAVVPLLTPRGLKARVLSVLDERRVRRERGVVALGLMGLTALGAVATLVPVMRSAPPGIVIARVTLDGRARAGVSVTVRRDGDPVTAAMLLVSDARGEVRYPVPDLGSHPYYDVYAREGNRAARHQVLAVAHGTDLPVQLALAPAHVVSGTVRGPDGEPVKDAALRILRDNQMTPGPGIYPLAHSDSQGHLRADGLLYGHYTMLLQAPWGAGVVREVAIDDRDVDLEAISLPREVPIAGVLHDESGQPRGGVLVDRTGSFGGDGVPYLEWDRTASDGTFRMLPPPYGVRATTLAADGEPLFATTVHVGIHGGVRVDDFTLRRAVSLSGRVHDRAGKPVVGVRVRMAGFVAPPTPDADTRTDDQGRFTATVFPPDAVIFVEAGSAPPARFGPYEVKPNQSNSGLDLVIP